MEELHWWRVNTEIDCDEFLLMELPPPQKKNKLTQRRRRSRVRISLRDYELKIIYESQPFKNGKILSVFYRQDIDIEWRE